MHPKIAERIATNLSRVKRVSGSEAAAKWWAARFPNITKRDYDEVLAALNRRQGKR